MASKTLAIANVAAAPGVRPPKAARGQRTTTMSATLARPEEPRSGGRRGAPVIALVVVPVIARVVVLVAVEIDAVQHHPDRSRLTGA